MNEIFNAALEAEVAELRGLLGELVNSREIDFETLVIADEPEGEYCRYCGNDELDKMNWKTKRCQNPTCPAVRARAKLAEKPEEKP